MKLTLEQKVSKGVQAKQQIADVGPRLQELENRYLGELLNAARKQEPTETLVFKLLALNDFGMDLQADVTTGRVAQQKLDENALQAARKVENG